MATPSSTDTATEAPGRRARAARSGDAPVVIEARGIRKTFRIPSHRVDSVKERMVHPFARIEYRELRALRDVSFEVRQGEFFGIVGRNGSGKSTLLKILASIYRADAGTIRMAGRPAPFIELGVGFNPDVSARENIVLNGVMMGLSQREARRRVDSVLDFAQLEEFADLKLKNYSSGMMVRLAFSVMLQSDAEILLIDEVLAVGDAAFQQKCKDVFHEMRDAGRTIVLVTHDMTAVENFCHRALLLHDGELLHIGDPEQVQRQYLRLNFAGADGDAGAAKRVAVPDVHARLVDSWLENEAGDRVTNVEIGQPIRFGAVFEALRDLEQPSFGFHCYNADGLEVFAFNRRLRLEEGEPDRLAEGQRIRIGGTIQNPLMPGRYFLKCWIARLRNPGDLALHGIDVLDFVVFGTTWQRGLVSVDADVDVATAHPEGR
jgi:ABC-2 type transport system ATP-binding protein